ncbi:hypothetical protein D3C81_2307890 [compost metagenome]
MRRIMHLVMRGAVTDSIQLNGGGVSQLDSGIVVDIVIIRIVPCRGQRRKIAAVQKNAPVSHAVNA